jgi:putative endonuclease
MGRYHVFGRACEAAAAKSLAESGWQVVARNYRCGHKEIDLIIRRGTTVAFVEVKGRSGTSHGHPLETIGYRKRRELAAAARGWIAEHGESGTLYRFDAIAVSPGPRGLEVEHIEDAWRL